MGKIEINTPTGERPKIAPHKLENGASQAASNCNFIRGDLRSFRAPLKSVALTETSAKTIYLYENNDIQDWVVSENDVDFVRSPIANDSYERVYFTGETEPRFFANDIVSDPFDASTDFLKLGIPAPTSGPTVVSTGGGSTYKGYVYSYVNSYGDEGPPSAVGSDDDFDSGIVAIEDIVAAPASRGIDRIFLYRTNSSDSGTAEFQYVLEATWFSDAVGYAVGDFVIYGTDLYKCTTIHSAGAWNAGHFTAGDDVADSGLLSIFPKTAYDPPPDDLTGIKILPNGCLVGFDGNALYFSEPSHPHAWPTNYIIGFSETIIGLGILGATVVVLTNGPPYKVYGSHPANMGRVKSDYFFPCLSKRRLIRTVVTRF
jgi:hypothetical protein